MIPSNPRGFLFVGGWVDLIYEESDFNIFYIILSDIGVC